jgi:hypothetical protein
VKERLARRRTTVEVGSLVSEHVFEAGDPDDQDVGQGGGDGGEAEGEGPIGEWPRRGVAREEALDLRDERFGDGQEASWVALVGCRLRHASRIVSPGRHYVFGTLGVEEVWSAIEIVGRKSRPTGRTALGADRGAACSVVVNLVRKETCHVWDLQGD